MIHFMSNPCCHPYCMGYDCEEWCPYFKPRLFGFIPVPRKLGGWLFMLEEKIFFKAYCTEHDAFDFLDGDDFNG